MHPLVVMSILALAALGGSIVGSTARAESSNAPHSRVLGKLSPGQSIRVASRTTPVQVYSFIDYPGSSATFPLAINLGALQGSGKYIAGGAGLSSGTSIGFLIGIGNQHVPTTYSFYPVAPSGIQLAVYGVNDHLEMVGFTNGSPAHGFMIENRVYTQFDVPFAGATDTYPQGANNAGVIAGYWGAADGSVHSFTLDHGVFTQTPDYPGADLGYTQVGGINNAGDMSGNTILSGVTHGFLLRNGVFTLVDPPGAIYTLPGGLNDSDEIVGFYCTATSICNGPQPDGINGFVYQNGTFATISIPGASLTEALGINNAGLVTGLYTDSSNGFTRGFYLAP